jgi:hypothetical protein
MESTNIKICTVYYTDQQTKQLPSTIITRIILDSSQRFIGVYFIISCKHFNLLILLNFIILTLSDHTSDLVRQYDFPVPIRCRKTSDTVFVAFVRPLSEPVRRISSCSTDFSKQIAQVVLFLFPHVFLF